MKAELESEERVSQKGQQRLPLARELDEALNSPAYELVLTGMIVTVSALYAIETLPQLTEQLRTLLMRIEAFISSIFVVEYLLRFYSQGLDPRYLLRKAMLIDFVSIFPLLVAQGLVNDAFELQFVRLLRVIRILRLERLVEEDTFRRFFLGRADAAYAEYKLRIAQIVFTLASIIWVTSGLIYDAEHGSNPQFQTYFDALYFSIVSLTTVGLGDLAPRTALGKLTISLAILVGVAIIPFQLGQLGRALFASETGHEHGPDGSNPLYSKAARRVECSRCGQKEHSHDARYCRICGERLVSSLNNGQNGARSLTQDTDVERVNQAKENS
jgi:voltage-gated potassium channel